jgi:AraC-like DNA-binding protein
MVGDPSFTIPAIHGLHLAELAKHWKVAPDELLDGLGVDPATLAQPDAQLAVPTMVAMVERARALTGEPALGIFAGIQMRVSAHGYLGFAAMTASTLRQALEIATRFAPTRTNALDLALVETDDRMALVIEERTDFGPARDAILLALTVGIWQIGNALTGRELTGSVDYVFPEPSYAGRFPQLLSMARFGQPRNQILLDTSALESPLTMSDPGSLRLATEQCERALAALCAADEVLDRVRRLALKKGRGARSIEEVAREMRLSSRTLKRRLAAQGMTYSDVLDEQRKGAALLLLRSGESIGEIAERLGYSDTANFGRAFRRWTGASPGSFRRQTRESG